jgi:GDP-mannose 4,6-dehydratase
VKRPPKIRRVLITGITGSGGSYLAEHVLAHHPGVEVHGLSRWRSTTQNLSKVDRQVVLHECDLLDFGSVFAAVKAARPDAIFHLAAHANVRTSFITPDAVLSNNILGTSHLLEAVRQLGLDPVLQICSTSEVYGQVDPKDVPIKEDAPLRPVSPYAVSKTAQDLLGFAYYKSYGMKIIRTRMFTYLNPRRTDLFATSFAKQVAWIERGLQTTLTHGNLNSVRTFIDVRDAVRAYWDAILYCRPGEAYNIGGVTTMTVGACLDKLKSLSRAKIRTKVDPRLIRPADVTLQIPCVDKFAAETGWKPRHDFDDSLENLLNHWRAEAARQPKPRKGGSR